MCKKNWARFIRKKQATELSETLKSKLETAMQYLDNVANTETKMNEAEEGLKAWQLRFLDKLFCLKI